MGRTVANNLLVETAATLMGIIYFFGGDVVLVVDVIELIYKDKIVRIRP
jgi:hypothetical protein